MGPIREAKSLGQWLREGEVEATTHFEENEQEELRLEKQTRQPLCSGGSRMTHGNLEREGVEANHGWNTQLHALSEKEGVSRPLVCIPPLL